VADREFLVRTEKETADPSAALGMTKVRAEFTFRAVADVVEQLP